MENDTPTVQQNPGPTPNDNVSNTLREEVEAQTTIAAKAKKVAKLAEMEIDHLCP